MQILLTLILIATGTAVTAHPGHLADVAGHNHWVAGAAIGIAVIAGVYGALKGKKETEEADTETAEEEVPA